MMRGRRPYRIVLLLLVTVGLVSASGPTRAAPVGQLDDNVVVQITSPRPGERLRGDVAIAGYALDRRAADGSGLNENDLQVFLNDSADERLLLDIAAPRQDSPAAAAAAGARFGQAGFVSNVWKTCSFPPGAYTIVVWVSSLATPGARNMAAVNVEIESCPPGTILYQDDFAARPGGVDSLRVAPGQALFAGQTRAIHGDFAVGLSGRCAIANVDCLYGFNLRELPGPAGSLTNSYYNFQVDQPNRTFALHFFPFAERTADLRLQYLLPWTWAAPIRGGTEFNRLALIAEGSRLRLFVNGQAVGEVQDERRPWGQIGWMANSIANPIVVEFDDLIVTTLGPPAVLEPVLRGP